MNTERLPLAGVVGWPIAQSKSPSIHGYWLKKHGIAGHYIPIGIRPDSFEHDFRQLPKLGFVGVNVTLPFKETVLAMADSVTDRANEIGAANTITFGPDGEINADNTDGIGFLENLKTCQPTWEASSGPAVVLGAGGAARAVISSLIKEGVPEIRLMNRTKKRADELAAIFGKRVVVKGWNSVSDQLIDAATLVNTSSLGMTGQPALEIELATASKTALVTDIVYSPLQTKLLIDAQARGMPTVDGLGMLLHQAVPGFERWFGARPTVSPSLRDVVLAQ